MKLKFCDDGIAANFIVAVFFDGKLVSRIGIFYLVS